jgi:hypothetical protein
MEDTEIIIQCQDKIIKGRFTYLKVNEFGIQLVEPDTQLRAGSGHIMIMALGVLRFTENGKITDYCFTEAIRLLHGLYNDYLFFVEHEDKIDQCIKEFAEAAIIPIKERKERILEFQKTKREWKKQFKANEMDVKEYTDKLKELKNNDFNDSWDHSEWLSMLEDEIIANHFNQKISCSISSYIYGRAMEVDND